MTVGGKGLASETTEDNDQDANDLLPPSNHSSIRTYKDAIHALEDVQLFLKEKGLYALTPIKGQPLYKGHMIVRSNLHGKRFKTRRDILFCEHLESGDEESLEKVKQKLPKKVKKRRKVYRDDGSEGGWEEYWDYVFPDDSSASSNLRLLQMARLWKQKGQSDTESEDEDEDDDET
uniref:Uncharacterized protein n=1 Tax=Amphimedon queenslandica TaxID=400682 RepID=A0A1X7VPF0_AMPQE